MPVQIGGEASTFTNINNPSRIIKEVRVDSVELTQQQILDQYAATKSWINAEGLMNISHWL